MIMVEILVVVRINGVLTMVNCDTDEDILMHGTRDECMSYIDYTNKLKKESIEKYIKIDYKEAQKFVDQEWYDRACCQWINNDDLIPAVFVPESIYNEYFKK